MDIKQLNEELSKILVEKNNRKEYVKHILQKYGEDIHSIFFKGAVFNVAVIFVDNLDKENAPIIVLDDLEETKLTLQDLLSEDIVFYELKPIEDE